MSGEDFIRAAEVRHQEIKQPVWLMSFADFAGCLLASFVLLYSLAQTDRERMQTAFGIEAAPQVEVGTQGGASEKSMATRPAEDGKDTDYLTTLLRTKIDAAPALAEIAVRPLPDRIALDLPIARINANLAEENRDDDLLFALAGVVGVIPNDSAIVAELPASTNGDNWTKGMALANALAKRLRDSGAPDALVARTGVSADGAAHIRLTIFRDADQP
jgi:flagellar motor protein MotB